MLLIYMISYDTDTAVQLEVSRLLLLYTQNSKAYRVPLYTPCISISVGWALNSLESSTI